MLHHYLLIAGRSLLRNKVHSLINLFGLSLGLACCLVVVLYVQDELTYDHVHPKRDRIFRVSTRMTQTGESTHYATSSMAVGPGLYQDYPEVEAFCRVLLRMQEITVQVNDKLFNEAHIQMVDSSVTSLFQFEFIEGNAGEAIRPKGVAICESLRNKYFEGPALAKFMKLNGSDYMVTAVFRDLPANTDLPIRAMTSLQNLPPSTQQAFVTDWGRIIFYTYLLFSDPADAKSFAPKLDQFAEAFPIPFWKENGVDGDIRYSLTPLSELHFARDMAYDTPKGNRDYLFIFSLAGIFLLLIACVNYINLSIAQSTRRSVEVGIRKAAGASQNDLVKQFLGESVVMTFLSLFLALVLVETLLPAVNGLADKHFAFMDLFQPTLVVAMLGLVSLVGLLAGMYPAYFLSMIRPAEVLKGQWRLSGRQWLRKVLVVVQFSISLGLVMATLVVGEQMRFLKNQDLGLRTDEVIVLRLSPADTVQQRSLPAYKAELAAFSGLKALASSGVQVPGERTGSLLFRVEKEGRLQEDHFNVISVDEDYLRALDIELVAGRNFERGRSTDEAQAFIVNEAFVKKHGWTDPIGKRLQWGLLPDDQAAYDGQIVGVVEDYHYASLHNVVEPLVILFTPNNPSRLLLVPAPGQTASLISRIEQTWASFDPNHPLEWFFLDEFFHRQYLQEDRLIRIFSWFSIFTTLIACMGLFGLASFITQQRTREIGIRKVMGAEPRQILLLLSRDFLWLVLVALMIATLAGVVALQGWLEGFTVRADLPWVWFAVAGIGALLLAFATTSYHAYRAASLQPARSMRME